MEQHTGARVLEPELIEAVVGDRQGEQECTGPSDAGAAPSGKRPYIHSAVTSWTPAKMSAIVVSHTFIVIVFVNPSVITRSDDGVWAFA
jgi:hypothetical protein